MSTQRHRCNRTSDVTSRDDAPAGTGSEETAMQYQCCNEDKPDIQSVQCARCNGWHHIDCANMPYEQWWQQDQLDEGSAADEELWKCGKCKPVVREIAEESALQKVMQLLMTISTQQQESIDELKQHQQEVKHQQQEVKDELKQYQQEVKQQQQEVKDELKQYQQEVKEELKQHRSTRGQI